MSQQLHESSTSSDGLFMFPFSSSERQASLSSSSASSSYLRSPSATTSTESELPTPPSYSLFDSEMDHIFHQTIDTSFLDSRPSSPTSFSLPVLEPIGNLEGRYSKHNSLLSPDCPPHLTLSLPHQSSHSSSSNSSPTSITPPRRPNDVETKRQIDVLTTILTSPNLLPTSLPSLPIPARTRSRSPSSSSVSPSRAKDEILGSTSTSMKSQKSWLDALKEAEIKAKAKRLAGATQFARL